MSSLISVGTQGRWGCSAGLAAPSLFTVGPWTRLSSLQPPQTSQSPSGVQRPGLFGAEAAATFSMSPAHKGHAYFQPVPARTIAPLRSLGRRTGAGTCGSRPAGELHPRPQPSGRAPLLCWPRLLPEPTEEPHISGPSAFGGCSVSLEETVPTSCPSPVVPGSLFGALGSVYRCPHQSLQGSSPRLLLGLPSVPESGAPGPSSREGLSSPNCPVEETPRVSTAPSSP